MSPEVEAILEQENWHEERRKLRTILLDCGLTEAVKWRKLCYTHEGGNVAIIQGFKDKMALMFFKGALLTDTHGLLRSQGENSQAALRLEFSGPDDVAAMEIAVRDYVGQAMAVERAGLKVEFTKKYDLDLPDELVEAMDQQPDLAEAFHALTPGRQRGWVLHIADAKQAATRAARVEKSAAKIRAGKGWNER